MASVLKYILYILHYTIHENSIIEWDHIISNDISFQLGGLRKNKKFYMTSYLVFIIIYGHIFKDFSREINVDFKKEPSYGGIKPHIIFMQFKMVFFFYFQENDSWSYHIKDVTGSYILSHRESIF
jgi:hypothetical protein